MHTRSTKKFETKMHMRNDETKMHTRSAKKFEKRYTRVTMNVEEKNHRKTDIL